MRQEENEIPKYKKKIKKNTKKSNHKHQYYLNEIRDVLIFNENKNVEDQDYWVTIVEICNVCNKIKENSKIINYTEYKKLKSQL